MKILIVTLGAIFCLHFVAADKWGEKIVFEDNFEGDTLDLDKWEYLDGCDERKGTADLQCYTKENVAVRNGTLLITARKQEKDGKQYTSGRIRLKAPGFLNATYVVSARLARGDLLWSVLYLVPAKDIGQYDAITWPEYASRAPDLWKLRMSYYYASASSEVHVSICHNTSCSKSDLSTHFNEYVSQWSPDERTWYLNDQHYWGTPLESSFFTSTDTLQLVLNLGVGKFFFEDYPPINASTWVKPTLEIDWVRVYSNATQPAQIHGVTHRQSAQYKLVVMAFLYAFLYASEL